MPSPARLAQEDAAPQTEAISRALALLDRETPERAASDRRIVEALASTANRQPGEVRAIMETLRAEADVIFAGTNVGSAELIAERRAEAALEDSAD